MDLPENIGIVVAAGDLHADAAFRKAAALAIKNGKASLAIEVTREPIPEGVAGTVPVWDAVTLNSGTEGAPQVDPVDKPVALLDGAELFAGCGDNFSIREASSEHFALALHHGCQLSFLRVAHLFASNNGLTPYSTLLDKAQRKANAARAKQELGIPEMVKRALMEDGWICRQTIIWAKPNPMPESVTDRCTKSHEYIFLLTRSERYYYDAEAIREPHQDKDGVERFAKGKSGKSLSDYEERKWTERSDGLARPPMTMTNREYNPAGRNKRSVWEVATAPFSEAHFATFPPALIEPCILAGTSEKGCCSKCGTPWMRNVERTAMVLDRSERTHEKGRTRSSGTMLEPPTSKTVGWSPSCQCNAPTVPCTVLDPFGGAGTTALVADRRQRNAISIELNPDYCAMQERRIAADAPLLTQAEAS